MVLWSKNKPYNNFLRFLETSGKQFFLNHTICLSKKVWCFWWFSSSIFLPSGLITLFSSDSSVFHHQKGNQTLENHRNHIDYPTESHRKHLVKAKKTLDPRIKNAKTQGKLRDHQKPLGKTFKQIKGNLWFCLRSTARELAALPLSFQVAT